MMDLIKLAVEIIFYALIALLAIYSLTMIYVLMRFGKSKVLSLILSAFYLIIMFSLYAAAAQNFNLIPFPNP